MKKVISMQLEMMARCDILGMNPATDFRRGKMMALDSTSALILANIAFSPVAQVDLT
ncbi:hypothetical protein [Peribacillus butanolivorans]|uniref:hypothetical protein n=1 Tax=Peribacillus butanolivorans TaxID=421767 RepID=UPI0037F5785F